MKNVFILNPAAGKVDASIALIPQIRAAAQRVGVEVDIEVTRRNGHAKELAARYAESGIPVRLYACGGDGTLSEVVQAVAGRPDVAVGCVPCGTGNDYVRNFGNAQAFLDLDAQLAAKAFPLDLISTPQGYGVDIFAAGLDAQVAYSIPKYRRLPFCGGSTAYSLSIVNAFFSGFCHKLHITMPDTDLSDTYMMLAICNGQQYGGGYCAAPLAKMDDGLLDVVLVKPIPRLKLVSLLGAYQRGEHLLPDGSVTPRFAPYLSYYRTECIDIEVLDSKPLITTLDGECSPQHHLHAEIAQHFARILLPSTLLESQNALQTAYQQA